MKLAEGERSDTKCQDQLPWAPACPWPEELSKVMAEDWDPECGLRCFVPVCETGGYVCCVAGFKWCIFQVVFDNRVDKKGL